MELTEIYQKFINRDDFCVKYYRKYCPKLQKEVIANTKTEYSGILTVNMANNWFYNNDYSTIAYYAISIKNTCKTICWDFDDHKHIRDNLYEDVLKVYNYCKSKSLYPFIDFNTVDGYKVWLFVDNLPSEKCYSFANYVKELFDFEYNLEANPKNPNLFETPFGLPVRPPSFHPKHGWGKVGNSAMMLQMPSLKAVEFLENIPYSNIPNVEYAPKPNKSKIIIKTIEKIDKQSDLYKFNKSFNWDEQLTHDGLLNSYDNNYIHKHATSQSSLFITEQNNIYTWSNNIVVNGVELEQKTSYSPYDYLLITRCDNDKSLLSAAIKRVIQNDENIK